MALQYSYNFLTEEGKDMWIIDLLFGIFLEILALAIIFSSNKLPKTGYGSVALNTQYYPKLIGFILLFLGSLLLIITLTKVVTEKTVSFKVLKFDVTRKYFLEGKWLVFFSFSIFLVLFVLNLTLLGFLLTSICYLFFTMVLLSGGIVFKNKLWKLGALAVGLSVAVFIVFTYGAQISLPEGNIFK